MKTGFKVFKTSTYFGEDATLEINMQDRGTKSTAYTGISRGRLIELENGATIPEGTRVSIIPDEPLTPGGSTNLKKWLREARRLREQLPATADSVELLRNLREGRAKR